ncbi:MAG: adenylate kinase [Chitinophagales bacterium]|nr:adenylate kinase [Chitinophagales bacterium]
MLNIILFGPPGSGKGTQAVKLKEKYGLAHISTGDIFRAVITTPSALGTELKSYMDHGQLVPDELTFRVLADYIDGKQLMKSEGIIFDGFPRTIPQAAALDRFFLDRNADITIVLSLLVQEEEVVQRLLLRGQTSGRTDDNNEVVIRKRMQVYRDQTLPLAAYYSDQHKFIELKGEGSVEEVFELLCMEVDRLRTGKP